MECGFMVGDFAITSYNRDVLERYRGLTCRVVGVRNDGYVDIVFDDDPNGGHGTIYSASTDVLTRLCGDEPDCETISEFLNDM